LEKHPAPKASNKIGIAIIALLPLLLFLRGLHTILTQEYLGTAKYGGIIHLYGTPATFAGLANIFLAGIVGAGLYHQTTAHKKRALGIGAAMLVGAITCFALSFFT
jgi:hypothetical protein